MGQKVNPHGLRVGIIKTWDSRWYADKKDFASQLVEDHKIRSFIKKNLFEAGISKTEIERAASKVKVTVFTGKPGIVIGKGGAGVEKLRQDLIKLTGKDIIVNVEEIRNLDMDAQLVAEAIAESLERRVSFRRAMKQAIQRTMRAGAKGIKTAVSGRLGGADMARTEGYSEGTIPLQTLRADINYGTAEADTTYGKIGVKVWIYKGEILPGQTAPQTDEKKPRDRRERRGKDRRDNKREGGRDNRERRGNNRRGQSPNRDGKDRNRQ